MTRAFASRAALESGDNRLYTQRVRIEWDPPKARSNLQAHGISFAEADMLRVISAWKANKRQRVLYEKGRG